MKTLNIFMTEIVQRPADDMELLGWLGWALVLTLTLLLPGITMTLMEDRGTFKRRTILISVYAACALVVVAFALVMTHVSVAENVSDASQEKWDKTTASWAEDRYGITAGADNLTRHSADRGESPCPTFDDCYTGTFLIGNALVPGTLIILGSETLIVTNGIGTQTELTRVD
jgi:hypothetical protein